MRKIVLQMMTTLNGRLDDPGIWVSGLSDELMEEIDRQYSTFDTILVGQTTYKEMYEYWPGALNDEHESENTHSMAHKMNTYKKYVITNDQEKRQLEWDTAEQVLIHSDEELIRFADSLKTQDGRDIHLSGGARLAQSFIRLGLVDEYHFYVNPTVSKGMSWFDQIEDKRDMELLSAKNFGDVVALYYKNK